MAIQLLVITEFGETLKKNGVIDTLNLQKIVALAKNEGMVAIGYVDPQGDTYFNELQLREAQKEIDILSTYSELSQHDLALIKSSVDYALLQGGFVYVKFEHIS